MHQVENGIRELYKMLYTQVPDIANNSIVAGGAIRDLLHGKPVKDIDVFLLAGVKDATNNGVDWWQWLGNNTTQAADVEYDDADFGVYNLVLHINLNIGYPVQFILPRQPKNPKEIIDGFPLDLSRVYFNPKIGRVIKTPHYEHAVYTKIAMYDLNTNPHYVRKIREKYPEYRFVKGGWS